jgi:hypothetical protein
MYFADRMADLASQQSGPKHCKTICVVDVVPVAMSLHQCIDPLLGKMAAIESNLELPHFGQKVRVVAQTVVG